MEIRMIKRTYRLEGMHCSNCAMRVESIEDELPGIKRVSASYQKGQMVVEFNEALVSEIEILAAVKRIGYSALAMNDMGLG